MCQFVSTAPTVSVAHRSAGHRVPPLSVVIPARDEATQLTATLASWAAQISPQGEPQQPTSYEVILVANNCTDDTVRRAVAFARTRPRLRLTVLEVGLPAPHANVGHARRVGGQYVLDRQGAPGGAIFYSDADTLADQYLVHHLSRAFDHPATAAVGARLSTGTQPLGAYHRAYLHYEKCLNDYLAHLDNRPAGHRYFSGAGMGVRTDVYRSIGGVQPLSFNEDKQLRAALEARDYPIHYSTDCVVHTSCRQVGRVSWGMSKQLAYWADREQRGLPLLVPHPGHELTRLALRRAIVGLRGANTAAWHALAADWWNATTAHHYLRSACHAAYLGEAVDRVWHCPNFVQQRRRRYPELPVARALALIDRRASGGTRPVGTAVRACPPGASIRA